MSLYDLYIISPYAAMTGAATVATLPLVAFYFERVALVGVPATALALPAMPLVPQWWLSQTVMLPSASAAIVTSMKPLGRVPPIFISVARSSISLTGLPAFLES